MKRRTRRALIEWKDNEYFHIDLEAYHGREVIVGFDIHNGDQVWVREISTDKEGNEAPGKLICIAKFAGNERRYIPQTFQNDANEKRLKSRMKRHNEKGQKIETEFSNLKQLELSAIPEMPTIEPAGPVLVVDNKKKSNKPQPVPCRADGAPVFPDDLSLARWAIENPDKLLPHHVRVLADCLSIPAVRAHFEGEGVDLMSLRDAIRSTSNQTAR